MTKLCETSVMIHAEDPRCVAVVLRLGNNSVFVSRDTAREIGKALRAAFAAPPVVVTHESEIA